eukprot:2124564-Amphidinium_carterae.1
MSGMPAQAHGIARSSMHAAPRKRHALIAVSGKGRHPRMIRLFSRTASLNLATELKSGNLRVQLMVLLLHMVRQDGILAGCIRH